MLVLLRHLFILARPHNALFPIAALTIGAAVSGVTAFDVSFYVSVLLIFLLNSIATIWNDFYDQDVDRVNGTSYMYKLRETKQYNYIQYITIFTAIISMCLAAYLGWIIFILSCIALWLSGMYNAPPYKASRRPVASIVVLSVTASLLPFLIGSALAGMTNVTIIYGTIFLLMRASVSLLKDYKDAKGDARYKKKTFLLVYGARRVALVSLLLFSLSFAAALLIAIVAREYVVALAILLMGLILTYQRLALFKTASYAKLHKDFLTISQAQFVCEIGVVACLIYL